MVFFISLGLAMGRNAMSGYAHSRPAPSLIMRMTAAWSMNMARRRSMGLFVLP
jgi:hypothetical protein